MEHISAATPTTPQTESAFDLIREWLPKLASLPDEIIQPEIGGLWSAAKCKRKCNGCTGYETCWREGDARGMWTVARVHDGQIKIEDVICPKRQVYEERERQERLLRYSGMTEDKRDYTFENFPEEQRRRHGKILQHALDFAETYDGQSKQNGLYLYGPPGIAKTHLMLAVLNRLNDRGIPSVFIRTDDLFDKLRAGKRDDDFDEVLERFMTVPVLGIDELSQERKNEFTVESIIRILNKRAEAGRPTWFTSNFPPPTIYESFCVDEESTMKVEALRSRVYRLTIPARMTGEDWRMNNLGFALGPDEEV